MSYNRDLSYEEEMQTPVERLAKQFLGLESSVQEAYEKLLSIRTDRIAMYDADPPDPDNKYEEGLTDPSEKVVATFAPGETIPAVYLDELQASLVEMKRVVDLADLDPIRKFA